MWGWVTHPRDMTQTIRTAAEFAEALQAAADAGKRVVLDCGATWCGPCKAIAPVFERLAMQNAATTVGLKMDVDEAAELAEVLDVTSMPTFFVFQGKELVKRFSGANSEMLRHAFMPNAEPMSHPMHSFQTV
jgi:thioredoxin 1